MREFIVIFFILSFLGRGYQQSCDDFGGHQIPYLPSSFLPFDPSDVASNWTNAALQPQQQQTEKLIPRNLWIACRTRPNSPSDLGEEHRRFIEEATKEGWNVYFHGH